MGERGELRRRLRERKREREARLLDLGAIVYELHRQGKRAPELLQRKAAALMLVDNQVRELEATLAGETFDPHPAERFDEPAEQPTEETEAVELEPEPETTEERA